MTATRVTPQQYLQEVQDQFSLSGGQAQRLISTVFDTLLRDKLGMELEDLKTIAYMGGQV